MGGAVLYNIPVYTKLGLRCRRPGPSSWPTTPRSRPPGVAPVIQTYGETWTSQLFVLGDFHNVAAAEPDFADKYTKNQAKYATSPAALKGFEHLEEVHDAGYQNKDFASAKLPTVSDARHRQGCALPDAVGVVATSRHQPGRGQDVGFFALPGDDAGKNGLTVWPPGGIYIPKTTEGDKLEAAKKFLAFVASPGRLRRR